MFLRLFLLFHSFGLLHDVLLTVLDEQTLCGSCHLLTLQVVPLVVVREMGVYAVDAISRRTANLNLDDTDAAVALTTHADGGEVLIQRIAECLGLSGLLVAVGNSLGCGRAAGDVSNQLTLCGIEHDVGILGGNAVFVCAAGEVVPAACSSS